jgi:uncharacterized protein (TIGR00369 family)
MMDIASPYAQTMGFGTERDSNGRLLLTMGFDTGKMGRPGFLHGGAISGMLETIAYLTLAEALGADDKPQVKPINVTVTFMRGGVDKITFARATIERLGRRIANIEAIAWQDDPAAPIAMAQMNVMLVRG